MTYRLPIRSICYTEYGNDLVLAVDLAVNQPTEDWLAALPNYQLEDGRLVGVFNSKTDARAAHSDAVTVVQAIDALGLVIAADQSLVYRSRRLSKLFLDPIVLSDERGNLAVLDFDGAAPESVLNADIVTVAHEEWRTKHPLKSEHGWDFLPLDVPKLSDGSELRVSSLVMDIPSLFGRVSDRRLV